MRPSIPLLMVLATAASTPLAPAFGEPSGQTLVPGRVVIRVEATVRAVPPAMRWVEKSGPKCVVAAELAGAIVNSTDSVDLVLKGGNRVRAHFDDDCTALGYYGGFYLKTAADGRVCEERDSIRTRSGDSCSIGKFKRLVPKVEKPRKP